LRYQHRFRVAASCSRVAEFHSRASSMGAITPPPMRVRLRHAPTILLQGDELDFTLWIGPLPVHWLARIESVSAGGFKDRQLQGPFAVWVHHHTFVAVDEGTTDVLDDITLRLRPHLVWGPIGLGMYLGLPLLFAYRGWKTKRMLQ
jgi:ligand-binding SRPBCC domain-containing protein